MITDHRLKYFITLFLSPFLISGLLLHPAIITFSHAASTITSDGTMGTTVTQSGKIYNINDGTIKGANQFHSFGLFSVGTGYTASFNGPGGIANIIGRVTGGQQSIIDGIIKSTISGANLFLLNPYGVLFGKNASLSVSGSFHVSTADYLSLSDGGIFYSSPLKSSVLTTAPPVAFGFLSSTPAPITIQESFLQVPRYKTLSVIGGDINITGGPSGYLYAPSGRINLASVKSSGGVVPNVGGAPDLGVESFSQLGAINLSNLAYVTVESSAGNGTIVIRGGRISVDKSYIIANTLGRANGASVGIDIKVSEDFTANKGFIQAGTSSGGRSGDVLITAGNLDMKNLSKIEAISMGAGNGGNVKVDTSSLNMTEGSQIRTNIWSSGNGGNVTVTAETAFLSGAHDVSQPTSVHAMTNDFSTGHGGDLRLTIGSLEVRDGAQISTSCYGLGNGGIMDIHAGTILLSGRNNLGAAAGIFSHPYSSGNAGGVRIDTGSLEIRNGAQISTSSLSTGRGSDIDVTADRILLTPINEFGVNSGLTTGLFARSYNIGDGGDIRIKAGSLEVMDGASISASSRNKGVGGDIEVTADRILLSGVNQTGNRSGMYSQSESLATGAAGDIRIKAGSLEIKDGAQIAVAALGPGNAGNLEVTADSVLLCGSKDGYSARINSSTETNARGGNIRITATDLEVKDGAQIWASTFGSGDAGAIEITADRVLVSGVSEGTAARISAQANPGSTGRGGDISIKTNSLEVRDGSEVSASTWGKGDSGTINIVANSTILDGGTHPEYGVGIYSSTYENGNAGDVRIKTAELDMKNEAQIAVATSGDGNAGTINLDLNHLNIIGGALISCGTHGAGNGGDMMINAVENILISGRGDYGSSGLYSSTTGEGNAGNIKVSTPLLAVENEAAISADTFGNGRGGNIDIRVSNLNLSGGAMISSGTHGGAGKGGTIAINASDTISISGNDSGLYSTSMGTGTGGNIEAMASNIFLADRSTISASSTGLGDAGNIDINTNYLLMNNSSITTEAKQADGGNIHIHAGYMVNLIDSVISASVGGGPDTVGGNITIDPEYVILNDSQIIANAYEGKGGNIRIIADVFLASPDSIVDASSALGIDGTVDIRAPITNISGTLAPMQGNFLSTEALLRDRCATRIRGERSSSFVVSGRDGLPIRPGSVLPSPIY